MAGRGRPPSGHAARRNRTEPRSVVRSDGRIGGHELPADVLGVDDAGNPIRWHPMTVRWWESWRRSPQGARLVTDIDWDFLLDTALMHHQLWASARWEVAAELRLRVTKLGATPEDRARLQFDIETPDDRSGNRTDHGNVTDLQDRRNRLTT